MDYSEEQRLQSMIALIAFFTGATFAFGAVTYALYDEWQKGNDITTFFWLPVFLLAVEGAAYFFTFRSVLETSIGPEGFSYRFAPIVRKKKTISFENIESWRVRRLRNFRDAGGVGYRKRLIKRRTAFAMGGNDCIEINLRSGAQFLFSTNNPEMLASAMKKYISTKEITLSQS